MPRMSIQSRVSRNIQRIRREKDLSQEEVAHRADIHQTYLSGVETGKRNPSILVVERIAKALGVDVADIFKPN
jgi:transcriptional regulator with XRE-family HTH domain